MIDSYETLNIPSGLCPQDYFGVCTEAAIKDNVVVVYELLEEMLDNGFPLATESNILKELIKPPTILRTMVNTITGTAQIHVNRRTSTSERLFYIDDAWLFQYSIYNLRKFGHAPLNGTKQPLIENGWMDNFASQI